MASTKGCISGGPRTVEVTLSGGVLFVALNGGEKRPLVPQSATYVSGNGLTYQFTRDDHSIATHVI
jgi:hypothetical protein